MKTSVEKLSPEHEDFKYRMLNPSGDMRGAMIPQETKEEMQRRYTRLTEKLIYEIVGDKEDGTTEYDSVVFLDKSARPVSWLMREMWPHVVEDTELPDIKFVNIDRHHYRDSELELERGGTYTIPQGRIELLRNIFSPGKPEEVEDWYEHHDGETYFTGKKVLVVDEIRDSGDTLKIAVDMFRKAFPEADISGYTWMIPKRTMNPDGTFNVHEAPTWYNAKDQAGRGVIDPLHDKDNPPTELLSQTPTVMNEKHEFVNRQDEKSKQLRKELGQLAKEYAERK